MSVTAFLIVASVAMFMQGLAALMDASTRKRDHAARFVQIERLVQMVARHFDDDGICKTWPILSNRRGVRAPGAPAP